MLPGLLFILKILYCFSFLLTTCKIFLISHVRKVNSFGVVNYKKVVVIRQGCL